MSEALGITIVCAVTIPTLSWIFISTVKRIDAVEETQRKIELHLVDIAAAIKQMVGIEKHVEEIEERIVLTETRVNEVVQNYLIRFDEIKTMLLAFSKQHELYNVQNGQDHTAIRDMVHIIKNQMTQN